MRILVVDDEMVSRKKMELIMQSFGECDSVETGQAAIDAYYQSWAGWAPFDLMMLDISMPDMDGTQVLTRIRQIERIKNVPPVRRVKIIMVTSRSDKDTIIACIRAGCNDYIVKPISRETVTRKLVRLLNPEALQALELVKRPGLRPKSD
jgi:two-component system, chemotaxis family, chemotaxis protein CheY